MRYFLTITLFIIVVAAFGQSKLRRAPLNPDYIKFLEEYEERGDVYAAPAPYKLDFKEYFKQKQGSFPESYPLVYDMRTAGPGGTSLLTSVKDQQSCGACWAFATYGSIESFWKVQGLGDHDLSENNLKNCHGFDLNPCQWGHHFMSTAYLVRGHGPVVETDDPYQPENNSCNGSFTPTAYIPESRYLPEDHDAFKQTIITQGAVYNTFRAEGYETIYGNLTLCYQGPHSTTHAIAIVGWNDTLTTGCGSGAWICKNEYGTNYGDGGYFYISYYDTLVLKYNSIWPIREDYDSDQIIYQYDTIGGWPFVGYEDPVAWGLVKFTASGDQFLTRLGTYTVSYGTSLKADIYGSFDGSNPSDLLMSIPELVCDFPGYWMLNLPEKLKIDDGEDFFVKIKYNSPGLDFPIAVEMLEEGYTIPHIESGKCWVSEDNSLWEACGTGTSNELDLCVKVYAFDRTKVEATVFLEGPFNGTTMNTLIADLDDFPLNQPYNNSPWFYTGNESVTDIPSDIVDWILVELRESSGNAASATYETILDRQAAFLKDDGSIVGLDGMSQLEFNVSVKDSLFLAIYHRNHIPVLSAIALQKSSEIYFYDFSTGPGKAHGGSLGHKDLGGMYGMISGDADANGQIGPADIMNIWNQNAGQQGYIKGDFNLNKESSNQDKNEFWLPNNGSSSQVPD